MAARGLKEIVNLQNEQLANAGRQAFVGIEMSTMRGKCAALLASGKVDEEQVLRMEISAMEAEMVELVNAFNAIGKKIADATASIPGSQCASQESSQPRSDDMLEDEPARPTTDVERLIQGLASLLTPKREEVAADAVTRQLRKMEEKVPVPKLSKTDPMSILTYLPLLKNFLMLDIVTKSTDESRNKLLATGFEGKVLNDWVTLRDDTRMNFLMQPTHEFVQYFITKYFPTHLVDDAYGQYVKGMQGDMSLRSFVELMRERRMPSPHLLGGWVYQGNQEGVVSLQDIRGRAVP
jgi:hypothetical protein